RGPPPRSRTEFRAELLRGAACPGRVPPGDGQGRRGGAALAAADSEGLSLVRLSRLAHADRRAAGLPPGGRRAGELSRLRPARAEPGKQVPARRTVDG